MLLTGLPPEVAHCPVPRPHRSALHWKDRCESTPVSPAGSQPQQPSWAEKCDPSFCKGGLSLRGQEPSSWHFPQSQVSEQGQKIHVSAPNAAETKASLRILVQLAHHTHSLTLPHANESLTFVSCFHLAFSVVLKVWTFARAFLTGRHKRTVPREEGRG